MILYDNSQTVRAVGYSSNSYVFRLVVSEDSFNIDTNKSVVTITEYAYGINGHSYASLSSPYNTISTYDTKTKQTITRVNNQISSIPLNKPSNIIGQWNGELEHDTNGELSLTVTTKYSHESSSPYPPISPVEFNTGALKLTSIPRASKISFIKVYEDEGTGSIGIKKSVSSYYDSVKIYYKGNLIKTIDGVVEGSNSFEFAENEYNIIYTLSANETSSPLKLTYVVRTYKTSDKTNLIGSNEMLGDFVFKENAKPTFQNFDYNDVNTTTLGLTNNSKIIINNYSNVKIAISTANKAIANKGATMSRYSFQDNQEEPYSSTNDVTHTLNKYNYGSNIIVGAIDSRNKHTYVTKSGITIVNYNQLPQISNIITQRKNGVDTETYLSLNAKLWKDNFNTNRPNEITGFKYRFKRPNETWNTQEWIDATDLFKAKVGNQSIDNIYISIEDGFQIHLNGTSGGIPAGVDYDMQLALSDGYDTTIFNTDYELGYVDNGLFLDSYSKSNTGYKYAINGIVDENLDDGLQVNGKLYLNGKEIMSKSAITAHIKLTDVTLGVKETVPFDSVWASIGDNFILNNGHIFSKKSCKVEISAQIWSYTITRSWFRLYVGNIGLSDAIGKSGEYAYTTFTMTPVISEITPEVGISILGLETTHLNAGANNPMATYITVKEL